MNPSRHVDDGKIPWITLWTSEIARDLVFPTHHGERTDTFDGRAGDCDGPGLSHVVPTSPSTILVSVNV